MFDKKKTGKLLVFSKVLGTFLKPAAYTHEFSNSHSVFTSNFYTQRVEIINFMTLSIHKCFRLFMLTAY